MSLERHSQPKLAHGSDNLFPQSGRVDTLDNSMTSAHFLKALKILGINPSEVQSNEMPSISEFIARYSSNQTSVSASILENEAMLTRAAGELGLEIDSVSLNESAVENRVKSFHSVPPKVMRQLGIEPSELYSKQKEAYFDDFEMQSFMKMKNMAVKARAVLDIIEQRKESVGIATNTGSSEHSQIPAEKKQSKSDSSNLSYSDSVALDIDVSGFKTSNHLNAAQDTENQSFVGVDSDKLSLGNDEITDLQTLERSDKELGDMYQQIMVSMQWLQALSMIRHKSMQPAMNSTQDLSKEHDYKQSSSLRNSLAADIDDDSDEEEVHRTHASSSSMKALKLLGMSQESLKYDSMVDLAKGSRGSFNGSNRSSRQDLSAGMPSIKALKLLGVGSQNASRSNLSGNSTTSPKNPLSPASSKMSLLAKQDDFRSRRPIEDDLPATTQVGSLFEQDSKLENIIDNLKSYQAPVPNMSNLRPRESLSLLDLPDSPLRAGTERSQEDLQLYSQALNRLEKEGEFDEDSLISDRESRIASQVPTNIQQSAASLASRDAIQGNDVRPLDASDNNFGISPKLAGRLANSPSFNRLVNYLQGDSNSSNKTVSISGSDNVSAVMASDSLSNRAPSFRAPLPNSKPPAAPSFQMSRAQTAQKEADSIQETADLARKLAH